MIRSEDISVIFQGPVVSETKDALLKCRAILPNAEIILSTWENSITDGLSADKYVYSVDPGAVVQHKRSGTLNNLNRQIRSTKAGLLQATRPLVLKLRSDLFLEHKGFLEAFDSYPKREKKYSVFSHKALVALMYSRVSYRGNATPFHISDWFFFGYREDAIKYYFAATEVDEPGFTCYFDEKKKKLSPYGDTSFRYSPEQYFGYSCWKQYLGYETMEDASDVSSSLIEGSDRFFVSNFIALGYEESGIWTRKYPSSRNEKKLGSEWLGLYVPYVYEKIYKKYCEPDFKINRSHDAFIFENKDYYFLRGRIIKHWNGILNSRGLKFFGYSASFLFLGVIFIFRLPFFILKMRKRNRSG